MTARALTVAAARSATRDRTAELRDFVARRAFAPCPAAVALLFGLTYDPAASCEAAEIVRDPDPNLLERAGRLGLAHPALARMARELAAAAASGCHRLGAGFLIERYLGEAADFLGTLTS